MSGILQLAASVLSADVIWRFCRRNKSAYSLSSLCANMSDSINMRNESLSVMEISVAVGNEETLTKLSESKLQHTLIESLLYCAIYAPSLIDQSLSLVFSFTWHKSQKLKLNTIFKCLILFYFIVFSVIVVKDILLFYTQKSRFGNSVTVSK